MFSGGAWSIMEMVLQFMAKDTSLTSPMLLSMSLTCAAISASAVVIDDNVAESDQVSIPTLLLSSR